MIVPFIVLDGQIDNKCLGSRAPCALQRGVSAVPGHVTAAALLL